MLAMLVGKTAPRLLNDLLEHEPRFSRRNGRNLLADPAPMFKGMALPPRTHAHGCRHVLMSKRSQTHAPISEDERPDASTKYIVASYCAQCKHHFDIVVDFTQGTRGQFSCRLSDEVNPMHHLRLTESLDFKKENIEFNKYCPLIELYRFSCTAAFCPVTVEIKISAPRLPVSLLQTIIDPAKLEARGKKVIADEPERYVGLDPLTPVQVLSNLRHYLLDAKAAQDSGDLRRIARRNKKYFLAFADECDSLFDYLDFKPLTEEGESQVSRDFSSSTFVGRWTHEADLIKRTRNTIFGNCLRSMMPTAISLTMSWLNLNFLSQKYYPRKRERIPNFGL